MSVTEQTPISPYTANGVTTVFAFSFLALAAADLVVQVVDTFGIPSVKTLGVDYTVSGLGVASGGSVTFLAPPPNGYKVVIYRNSKLQRATDYQNNGDLLAATVNLDFDRVWLALQEIFLGSKGPPASVRVPNGESIPALPNAAARALTQLLFDANGDPYVAAPVSGSAADVLLQLANAASPVRGAALVAYNPAQVYSSGIGQFLNYLHSQVAEEAAASIVPTNYAFLPGDVRRYGAVVGNVTDCTAAIQTAINTLIREITYPPGQLKVTGQMTVPQATLGQIHRGRGKTATILKASGTFNAVFLVGSTSAQTIRGGFFDMQIDCTGATVQYGIYCNRTEEFDFERMAVWGAKAANIATSSFSYANNYKGCDLAYGAGDGLRWSNDLGLGANNANTVEGCLFLGNAGYGIKGTNGYGVRIFGCTIEQNAKAGIFLGIMSGVKIHGNYFESNGGTGVAFASPALTVKSDIIINGVNVDTSMSNAFPCVGVDIRGNNTVPGAGMTSFIWDGGAVDLSVGPNYCFTTNAMPCVGHHYDPQYKGYNLSIEGCSSFTIPRYITGATASVNNTTDAQIEISCPSLAIERRNFANPDFLQWSLLAAGTGVSVFRRSQGGSALYRLNGLDVWELSCSNAGSGGTSDIYGTSVTATDYPELIGKQVWYGMWVYATSATCYAFPYCNKQGFNNNPTTAGQWKFIAVSFVWPNSGTVDIGIARAGSSTGSVYFSAPMLCPVGFPQDKAVAAIQKPPRIWYGGAMPAAGAWEAGDQVLRLPQVVGQPKGWSRITTGSANVLATDWASQGNL